MKARQANTGGGAPIFFISGKEGKKGLFFRSSNNEDYIDPSLGKIHVEQDREGKNTYVQYFQSLTGYISDVKVKKTYREMPGKGKVRGFDIVIEMDSDGTDIRIMFNFDSSYGRKFAQIFRNVKLKEEVTIKPYNWIPKDKPKAVLGMNLYRGDSELPDDAYKPYYDRENTPSFEVEGRDGPEYDSKAANNWLYKQFIDDVYHAFDHYEEEEKEESAPDSKYDPGNRKDYRDDKRSRDYDDDEDDGRRDQRPRNDDRRDSAPRDDRRDSRDNRREPRREERREERRDTRDDDRRDSRDSRDDRGRDDVKRSDGRDREEVARKPREEPRQMTKEEFAAQQREKGNSSRGSERDSRGSRDDYNPNAGMDRGRDRDRTSVVDDNDDLTDEDLPF